MAKVIKTASANFIGTYPEKTEGMAAIPLVLFIGGVKKYSYALKEHLSNNTPESIKQKCIFVFGNIGSDIKQMYSYGIELAKKAGIQISDNKLLVYSGGSENAVKNLGVVKLSLIGMMDPTPLAKQNFKFISGYESRIRMVYKPGEWEKVLSDRQPEYSNLINSKGGKAILVEKAHRIMPEEFFRIFGQQVVNTSSSDTTTTPPPQQQTSTSQTSTSQAQQTTQNSNTSDQQSTSTSTGGSSQGSLNPQINSATVSKLMSQYEKMSLVDDEDITTPTIDQTTSINGIIKHFIEKEHRENFLKEDEELTGTVFRVPRLYTDTDYSHQQIVSVLQTSPKEFFYKVRVHKLDSCFGDIPDTYDGTPEDIATINRYRNFTAPSNLKLKVGDMVSVTLGDMLRHKHGIIIRKIPESAADLIVPPPPMPAPTSEGVGGDYGIPISNGSYTPGSKSLILPFDVNENRKYPKLNFNTNISAVDNSFQTYLSRSSQYRGYVTRIARIYGVPPNLILAFISVESGFIPTARSPVGAMGLTQFMPGSVTTVGGWKSFRTVFTSEGGSGTPDPYNPKHSIILCCAFVKFLLGYFKGNVEKSASAYNTGWGRDFLKRPDNVWKGLITTKENSDYVVRVPYAFTRFNAAFPDGKE